MLTTAVRVAARWQPVDSVDDQVQVDECPPRRKEVRGKSTGGSVERCRKLLEARRKAKALKRFIQKIAGDEPEYALHGNELEAIKRDFKTAFAAGEISDTE